MENKKANLPITIFVLGVVAICILTIFSFVASINKVSSQNWGFGLVEEAKADLNKFYFYRNVGFSYEESAKKIDARILEEEVEGKAERFLLIKKFLEYKSHKEIFIEYRFPLK